MLPILSRLIADDDLLADALSDLSQYPNVTPATICRHARLIGRAGEALLDSILLRHGLFPSPLPSGASADRLVPLARRSLRLQIKTRTRPSERGYHFKMQKGYRLSPGGCRGYDPGDYDIAALVALPINTIMFSAARTASILMPLDQLPRLARKPLESLEAAVAELLERERADDLALLS
jgi:hypothetical protein